MIKIYSLVTLITNQFVHLMIWQSTYFPINLKLQEYKTIVFVAGIAKINPLIDYVKQTAKDVIVTEFSDHHNFQPVDIVRLINQFKEIISSKILITTEKDAMRLKDERLYPLLEEVPLFTSY